MFLRKKFLIFIFGKNFFFVKFFLLESLKFASRLQKLELHQLLLPLEGFFVVLQADYLHFLSLQLAVHRRIALGSFSIPRKDVEEELGGGAGGVLGAALRAGHLLGSGTENVGLWSAYLILMALRVFPFQQARSMK